MTPSPALAGQPPSSATQPSGSAAGTPLPIVSQSDWLAEYPPPRSLPLDQEALRVFEHAYALGLKVEEEHSPKITFTTVIAALLVGQNDTSRWFGERSEKNGPQAQAVFAEKKLDLDTVQREIPPPGKPQPVRLSADKHLLTVSARTLLGNAEGWAQRVGGSDIGVRHLVAAVVLNPPPAHRDQMQNRWHFHEVDWRRPFFTWAAERYTAEQWVDASNRPAPAAAIPTFEQTNVKGSDLAFPGDASALDVLERAASYHARQKGGWLRLQTLFHALVELVRSDTAVGAAIKPIAEAVKQADASYQLALHSFIPPTEPARITPFASLEISPRVLNALETARELAAATRGDSTIEARVGVRHLAGALVSRRVDADTELAAMGLQPQALRLELIKQAEAEGESGEKWREALGEEESVQAGRPLDLNSDEPEAVIRLDQNWTSDPLAIRRDVETFAALLASASLDPPLSIGLFGPWGSGKTTFLKRLRRSVERLADEAKTATAAAQSTPYVREVVHVDFNAWHFAEDALTSSLVETILRELERHIRGNKPTDGKERRQQTLDVLETTQRKIEAAQALQRAAEGAVTNAQEKFLGAQANAAEKATSFQSIVQNVWSTTKKEFKGSSDLRKTGVLEAVGDSVTSTEELRDRLAALRNRPARLLGDLGWPRSLMFVALVLVVPLLAAWLTEKVLGTNQVPQLLSAATATLSVIGVWARTAAGAVAKVDKAVTEVAHRYATFITSDTNVISAQKDLDAANANAATAAAELQAAREDLARATTEAASATIPAQMLQLASGRIEAQTYNKELTTLSLARADLEALSRWLRDQRSTSSSRESEEPAATAAPARAVDRVILYIDDLDRCKPDEVVRVLQLVHMLLAFELFVVVVAVDARWVTEALRQKYPWLGNGYQPKDDGPLANDAAPQPQTGLVTPQDYLEKIFQIAFWLEPMSVSGAASYLASLVRAPARDLEPAKRGSPQEQPIATGASAPATAKVEISVMELDYMRYLAAYVGSSPRRVKRLVNVYRLIKAGLSASQLNTFLKMPHGDDGQPRSGPYQLVIGLLVIGTGASASSAQILGELAECDPGEKLDDVVDRLRGRNHPDWIMAAQVIEALMRSQKATKAAELRGWARKVGRYLMHGPQDTRAGVIKLAAVASQR